MIIAVTGSRFRRRMAFLVTVGTACCPVATDLHSMWRPRACRRLRARRMHSRAGAASRPRRLADCQRCRRPGYQRLLSFFSFGLCGVRERRLPGRVRHPAVGPSSSMPVGARTRAPRLALDPEPPLVVATVPDVPELVARP
jgi:hypothetical protein